MSDARPCADHQWRRAWASGGREALRSQGPLGYDCRLGPGVQAKLAVWLEEGPVAHSWTDDQVAPDLNPVEGLWAHKTAARHQEHGAQRPCGLESRAEAVGGRGQ